MKIKSFVLNFFLLSLILISCNPNNPQPNQNNPQWKIKFTINGVTHEAKGNTFTPSSNHCFSTISQQWLIDAAIADKTASSYISGDNGGIQMQITNPSLGTNPLSNCLIYGSWLTDVLDYSGYGYSLTQNGPMVPNSMGALGPRIPITFTSLGMAGNGSYSGSQSIKGEYSGTLYFKSDPLTTGFDIPVNLDIEFEALRP